MNAVLADAALGFFFVIAPGLLAIRFVWPRVLPRRSPYGVIQILWNRRKYAGARLADPSHEFSTPPS